MDRGEAPWYEALYQDFADYDAEPYTQNTVAEVDFVESQIGSERALRVLDVGCGTGRHSLELARRGYEAVTGIDLSDSLLGQARAKAEAEGLTATFRQMDARALPFAEEFDVVLMLCEGGFSLMEADEMDRQILRGVARALRPGGRLIMTAPNAAAMLANLPEESDFDVVQLREQFTLEHGGETLRCSQRYYTFPELHLLLEGQGFAEVQPFAVTPEGYDAGRAPRTGDFELGVTAVKNERA